MKLTAQKTKKPTELTAREIHFNTDTVYVNGAVAFDDGSTEEAHVQLRLEEYPQLAAAVDKVRDLVEKAHAHRKGLAVTPGQTHTPPAPPEPAPPV